MKESVSRSGHFRSHRVVHSRADRGGSAYLSQSSHPDGIAVSLRPHNSRVQSALLTRTSSVQLRLHTDLGQRQFMLRRNGGSRKGRTPTLRACGWAWQDSEGGKEDSRSRLLNLTGFFSSAGGLDGAGAPGVETPAIVAVSAMTVWECCVDKGP